MTKLATERLLIADFGLAAAEWMFEETRAYVKQRKAFKKTIADLQVGGYVSVYTGKLSEYFR